MSRRQLLHTRQGLIALSLLIGAAGGVGAIAFRELIIGCTMLFSGHHDYSDAGREANHLVPFLGPYFVVLAPVVGGLLYGPLVARFAPEARGHGVPEVMLAVARNGGRIRPQVPAVKALASAICIGSGGSVGREGPIVQIASAIGSGLGQLVRAPERQLRLLVACGAAAGISATFNAPIAGVFFALEVILRDFQTDSFAVVVLSSVTADVIGRAAFGSAAFLQLPTFAVTSPFEYLLYAGLGIAAAGVGLAFVSILYRSEDAADRIWRGPEWARPVIGGVALGLLLLALPEMYGVGYPVLENVVRGHEALWFVVVLLLGKIAATSLTMSIGGSGGVFAPSLFLGAMLGSAYGRIAHAALPGLSTAAGAYGLVGMGAVFAASARAPITAVLIIFELTGDYSVILPLMVAVVIATAVASAATKDNIYTRKLLRRGVDIDAPTQDRGPLGAVTVAAAMGALPAGVAADATIDEIADALTARRAHTLPVAAPDGTLIGVVSLRDLEAVIGDATPPDAAALAHLPEPLRTGDPLDHALDVLTRADDDGLPVLDAASGRPVGWLTHRDLLTACRAALAGADVAPAVSRSPALSSA